MPERTNVAFGYDPAPFQKGIEQNIKAMGMLTKRVTAVAGEIVKKLLLVGVAIKGAQMLWNKFKEGAPEIQKAFTIASDVIFKNFFWPLRQALLPVMQRLLDWVRDHRTLFVQWGSLVVSVFKTAVMVAKGLYSALKSIVDAIAPRFKQVFSGGFMDTMNLFLAKVAFIAAFIVDVIKSIAGNVGGIINNVLDLAAAVWDLVKGWLQANAQGDSFWTLVKALAVDLEKLVGFVVGLAKQFLGGFKDALGGVMTPLTNIAKTIGSLVDAMKRLNDRTGVFSGTLRALGAVLGEALMAALQGIQIALTAIVQGLEMLPSLIGTVAAMIRGDKAALEGFRKERQLLADADKQQWSDMFAQMGQYWKGQGQTWQNVGAQFKLPTPETPGGAPLASPARPGGEQIAGAGGGASNFTVNLNVTEGNARAAGSNFAAGMHDQIRRDRNLRGQ